MKRYLAAGLCLGMLAAGGAEARYSGENIRATAQCALRIDDRRGDWNDVRLTSECDAKHTFHDNVEVIHIWVAGGSDYKFVHRGDGWFIRDGRGKDHRVTTAKSGRVLSFDWSERGHHFHLRIAVD